MFKIVKSCAYLLLAFSLNSIHAMTGGQYFNTETYQCDAAHIKHLAVGTQRGSIVVAGIQNSSKVTVTIIRQASRRNLLLGIRYKINQEPVDETNSTDRCLSIQGTVSSLLDNIKNPHQFPNQVGFFIELPHNLAIAKEFWTGYGTIFVHNLSGFTHAQTSQGSIEANNLQTACLLAPQGSIVAENVSDELFAKYGSQGVIINNCPNATTLPYKQ